MHLGALEQEGLRGEVTTVNSGAEIANALLTGDADLGLSGSIRVLDLAEKGSRDRIISIIQVNSRDGFFVLGRGPQPRFQWADLMGSRFILFGEHDYRLCIDLDGGQHYTKEGQKEDEARAMFLAKRGIRILRFSNVDVLKNLEGVLLTVVEKVTSLTPPLSRRAARWTQFLL
jgi:hypothetical protein